jgi:Flp pilus assembly protein TadG
MALKTFFDRLRRAARELRTANGANVTITFALATIPMVGFVGAAVDYSHANSVKTALQAATDATALMLSKNAASWTNSQIQTKATDYLTALFHRPEATGLSVTATYNTSGGSQILVVSSANVKTNFMGLLGFNTMRVGADSQVKWGNTRLRVALVLDNTGSMEQDGKMTALKTATNNLLDQLKSAAAQDGDVYVSIIPFVKDVNVGAGNYQAKWIDWTDWDENNGSCSKGWGINTKSDCLSQNGNPKWTPDSHSTWNGCVTDRGTSSAPSSNNYDVSVTAPTTTITASLFPAEQYNACPQAIKALNYDWTGMKTLVSAMSPNGTTNQAIGLVHGWMSLVGGGPYPTPPAEDPNYKYSKVVILLTDGLNTENRWWSSQSPIDNREAITCSNIKAAGITLYTIQVNTGGDPTSSLLQTCASDSSKFFLLTSANQIVSTFQQIGVNLSNLRISQ